MEIIGRDANLDDNTDNEIIKDKQKQKQQKITVSSILRGACIDMRNEKDLWMAVISYFSFNLFFIYCSR